MKAGLKSLLFLVLAMSLTFGAGSAFALSEQEKQEIFTGFARSFEIQQLRPVVEKFVPGQDLVFAYELVNVSTGTVKGIGTAWGPAVPFHDFGLVQGWITPVDKAAKMTIFPSSLAQNGNNVAAGGEAIRIPGVAVEIAKKDSMKRNFAITSAMMVLKPGTYRFTLEWRDIYNRGVFSQKFVEFTIE